MTSIETVPTWSERLNPRNWTLAWKLVVVGLVPALLALVLGALRVSDQAEVAADLGRSTRLLEVQQEVAVAADGLRTERHLSTIFAAGGRSSDRNVLRAEFDRLDGQLDQTLGVVRGGRLDPSAASALQQAEADLATLGQLRTGTLAGTPPAEIRERYDELVESVDVLDRALIRQLRTPDVAGLADALTAVTSASEQLAVQHTALGSAIAGNRLTPDAVTAAEAAAAEFAADAREYQVALTPAQLAQFGDFSADPANADRARLATAVTETPEARQITVPLQDWDAAYQGSREAADRSTDLLRNQLVAASTAAEERASNLAGINSVVLMLGLLLGITVAVLVARALIRSLRVLRTAALDVAERQLPEAVENMRAGETPDVNVEPVPLGGRDEVAQVARAFDAVHGQAIRLAADQVALQANVSAMFVNLSRRSQALVERQLQLIEQLESNEQDADQLSNLFQLDHLATRMRRNSENLLVLAGTDLAKRNIAPVPLVDVLRAAVSEIEQYQRIVVQAPPNTTIVGRAASDLVHLLAELLDNATNFSPPDSQVVMSTTRTADGSIVVEIADRGVGMVDHELSDANQRLGGPSTVDVSASRRMGLFVVGRLGARHGIGVRLATSSGGGHAAGLTASVSVPAYLIPASGKSVPSGRPLGVAPAPGVPAQGGSGPEVPPLRAGMNGTPRGGSLSGLVAGGDGPANPGMFDPPVRENRDGDVGGLFSPPTPPAEGAGDLPTRRPGSNLQPDGTPPHRPDPAEQAAAERAAREQAREVAERARRDQEQAAERQAAEARDRRGADGGDHELADDAPAQDGLRNGVHPDVAQAAAEQNGAVPHASNGAGPHEQSRGPVAGDRTTAADDTAKDRGTASHQSEQAREEPGTAPRQDNGQQARPDQPRPEQLRPQPTARTSPTEDGAQAGGIKAGGAPVAGGARTGGQEGSAPRRDAVPPAPPTAPMPFVQRIGGALPQRPASRPDQRPADQRAAQQRPVEQRPTEQRQGPVQQGGSRPFPPAGGRPAQPGPAQQAPRPPAPAPQRAEGLFAPAVPVIAEPEAPQLGHRPEPEGSGFEMGETTPIFEEIASAWFRSNRKIPVEYGTEEAATGSADASRSPAPAPAPAPAPEPAPAPVEPVRRPAPAAQQAPAPEPAPAPGEPGFANPADEGWRAADTIAADRQDELTQAGLPKRRPRARLVPGSAGSAVLAAPVSPARSAENVRGRLASYQQGVRQGRENRGRDAAGQGPDTHSATEPANAGGNHDEETS